MTVINIPARDPQKAFYSWYIVTREEVGGKRLAVWAPALTDESLTRQAATPVHPVDRQSSVMDDAILGNLNYSVRLRYNTMLENDRPNKTIRVNGFDVTTEFTDFFKLVTGFEGLIESYPPAISDIDLLSFIRFAQEGLLRIQGIPVDVYSPKFGLLENFVLTGYNDTRALASEANMQLSFTERRVTEAETAVIDTSAIKARETARRRAAKAKKEKEEAEAKVAAEAEAVDRSDLRAIQISTGNPLVDGFLNPTQNLP